jgi:hypothetical protein
MTEEPADIAESRLRACQALNLLSARNAPGETFR